MRLIHTINPLMGKAGVVGSETRCYIYALSEKFHTVNTVT